MAKLIDLYAEILTFDNKQVVMIIDNKNNPWFLGKHIGELLEYKNSTEIIRTRISSKYKKEYGELQKYSKYNYPLQRQTIFINESGLYELLNSSRMDLAKEFKNWLNEEVIPQIRKEGKYEASKSIKQQIAELNNKIVAQKQQIMILENNNSKPQYPKGGHIYVIQPPSKTKDKLYKIGKSNDLEKRMKTYNTSYPDRVISIFEMKVDNPEKVERCIKAYLDDYQYRPRKEFYKIGKNKLLYIVQNCAKTMKNKSFERKLFRHISKPENFDENEEIFGILSVPYDYNENQEGGGKIQYNTLVNKLNKTKKYHDQLKQMSSLIRRMKKFNA